MPVDTDVVRRVFDVAPDGEPFIEIGPGDGGLTVTMRTTDIASEGWFGKIDLGISWEMAAELGKALLQCSSELSSK